jgi:hypothetical protein
MKKKKKKKKQKKRGCSNTNKGGHELSCIDSNRSNSVSEERTIINGSSQFELIGLASFKGSSGEVEGGGAR